MGSVEEYKDRHMERKGDKMAVYDPGQWKYCENITVGQFMEYLKNNVSSDAVLHVCGSSQFYIHVPVDGDMACVDDCDLSDLSEYEGSEPERLGGLE